MKKIVFLLLLAACGVQAQIGGGNPSGFSNGIQLPNATHEGDTITLDSRIPMFDNSGILNYYLNIGDLNEVVGVETGFGLSTDQLGRIQLGDSITGEDIQQVDIPEGKGLLFGSYATENPFIIVDNQYNEILLQTGDTEVNGVQSSIFMSQESEFVNNIGLSVDTPTTQSDLILTKDDVRMSHTGNSIVIDADGTTITGEVNVPTPTNPSNAVNLGYLGNYVDKTSNEVINGEKTFNDDVETNGGFIAAGNIVWRSNVGSQGAITHNNTSSRTYTFPNKSGTVALLDDISAETLQETLNAGNTATFTGSQPGIDLDNTGTGTAISIDNSSTGLGAGMNVQNNNSGGYGYYVNENAGGVGLGIAIDGSSGGRGINISNAGTGIGVMVSNTAGTGFNYVGRNGTTNTFTINKEGEGFFAGDLSTDGILNAEHAVINSNLDAGVINGSSLSTTSGITTGGNVTATGSITANGGNFTNDITVTRDGISIVEILGIDAQGGIVGTDTDHDLILRRNNAEKLRLTSSGIINSGNFTASGNIATQMGINLNKPDSGIMGLGFEDDYLRWRRGGSGTVLGWRWDIFETTYMTLGTGGHLTIIGDMSANDYITTSDSTMKHDIKPIELEALDIEWHQFYMNTDSLDTRLRYGALAQEVEVNYPQFVHTNADGKKSISYIDLLIVKIRELEARLEDAEATIIELQNP